ncbi:MAG: prephenate dehydratase [Gammaproteobacteria bacterium RIFCSPHIGHO2_12_FULL_45_9]|nr:MAG: prephenate dehydratase [Gammaproteobacteria bacterium RIFCSPHIGHO2_12_FULL_45_9]
MLKIGIQGTRGSFSEVAAHTFAEKHAITPYEPVFLLSSENVLAAVEAKTVDYGIVAIENSQGGVVIETIFALAKHRCHIVDMFQIPISQTLLAHPAVKRTQLTAIHSHEQALRQCREFLRKAFPDLPLVEEIDTAEAGRRLMAGELPQTAGIIGNALCAEIYGLQILQRNIQDLETNLTLFLGIKPL